MSELKISLDQPISKPSQDKFGRTAIRNTILNIITSFDTANSLAIGICGEWGSGKSSLINLVKTEIYNDNSEYENVEVIDFNPWLYSSDEDLIKCFFSNLLSKINSCVDEENKNKERNLKIAKGAMKICKVIPLSLVKELASFVEYYLDVLSGKKEGSLDEIKKDISNILSETKYRLVIVIDDIDRLDVDEIKKIIRLVRSVADFSNVCYILSYDEKIVCKALECESYCSKKYLQKIIQLPIHLPMIDNDVLKKALNIEFNRISSDIISEFDKEHMDNVLNALYVHVKTIRDVNILLNRYEAKYDMCGDETCPADLLAVTFLELHDIEIIHWLSENVDNLCDWRGANISKINMDKIIRQSAYDEPNSPGKSIEKTGFDPCYKELLKILFPPSWGDKSDKEYRDKARKERRISCHNHFKNYFYLNPSSNMYSRREIFRLAEVSDCNEICKAIIKGGRNNTLDYLMTEIITYLHDKDRIELFVRIILFDEEITDDDFVNDTPIMIPFGPDIIDTYMNIIGKKNFASYFLNTVSDKSIKRIARSVELARHYECFKGTYKNEDNTPLTNEEIEKIEETITSLVFSLNDYNDILTMEEIMELMYSIYNNGDVDDCRLLSEKLLKTDKDVVEFINLFDGRYTPSLVEVMSIDVLKNSSLYGKNHEVTRIVDYYENTNKIIL